MYLDSTLSIDRSHHAGKLLLAVTDGRTAQRVNRALGSPYPEVIGQGEEALFHLSTSQLLVALLAAGRDKAWARAFVSGLEAP